MNYCVLKVNTDRWGWATGGPQLTWINGVLEPAVNKYYSAYYAWKDPSTRTVIITNNFLAAEKNVTPYYRQLYKGFFRDNPLVTDEDLITMGMPKRSIGGHHPVDIPTTSPRGSSVSTERCVLAIHYEDEKKPGKGKPKGVHGVEMAWIVADEVPKSFNEYPHSTFDTKTPIFLHFDSSFEGKTVFYILRWENTRGEKGPWSPTYTAVIS
jgi:hypothetical protein